MPGTSALRGQLSTDAQTINIAGAAATIVLSTDQVRSRVLTFTGAITGAQTLVFPVASPDDAGKSWLLYNACTGTVTLAVTVGGPTGAAVTLPRGRRSAVLFDGTDFKFESSGAPRSDVATITITTTAITLTETQYTAGIIVLAGTPSADRTVLWPAAAGGPWVVVNGSDNAQTCKIGASTGVAIAAAKTAILYASGVDMIRITADT